MAISNSIEVAADPEATFARLADLDSAGDWNTVHVDYPAGDPGPAEAGKSFKESVSLMGMPAEVEWTIETAAAPSTLAMKKAAIPCRWKPWRASVCWTGNE